VLLECSRCGLPRSIHPFENSEWSGVTAGGCFNHWTWRLNPQFRLSVMEPDVCSLYMCVCVCVCVCVHCAWLLLGHHTCTHHHHRCLCSSFRCADQSDYHIAPAWRSHASCDWLLSGARRWISLFDPLHRHRPGKEWLCPWCSELV
jgi:hypothetical protein